MRPGFPDRPTDANAPGAAGPLLGVQSGCLVSPRNLGFSRTAFVRAAKRGRLCSWQSTSARRPARSLAECLLEFGSIANSGHVFGGRLSGQSSGVDGRVEVAAFPACACRRAGSQLAMATRVPRSRTRTVPRTLLILTRTTDSLACPERCRSSQRKRRRLAPAATTPNASWTSLLRPCAC